jgi:hypothetical protein
VDLNVGNIANEDIWHGRITFSSALWSQRESADATINRCKTAGVKVVAGGPLFTMEHEQFPDTRYYFFLNEAEETWRPFVLDLAEGQA